MNLDQFKLLARNFCEEAVDGERGVRLSSPIYRRVTENRDPGAKYSSCADLAHAMLFHLGVREKWVNRAENGKFRWGLGPNLLIAKKEKGAGAGGLARVPQKEELFQQGDIIVMWQRPDTEDAHVCVVDSFDGRDLRSWDYGQGPMKAEAWKGFDHIEGRKRVRHVMAKTADKGLWVLEDGRIIRSVLPIESVFLLVNKTPGVIA